MFFREWWREAQQNRYVILKKGKVGLRKMKIDELNVHFHKILEGHVMKSLEKNQWSWRAWTAACQASLSFTISRSLLKLMSIESMMRSNHLILCLPLLLVPSIILIQFSSVAQSCSTLRPHGLQHARLPRPSLPPEVCSNSCPLRRWCHNSPN